MNIISEKYKLVEWLISLEDEEVIAELRKFQKKVSEYSSTEDNFSDTKELMIQAGLKDIQEGRTHSHNDIIREVKEKYGI